MVGTRRSASLEDFLSVHIVFVSQFYIIKPIFFSIRLCSDRIQRVTCSYLQAGKVTELTKVFPTMKLDSQCYFNQRDYRKGPLTVQTHISSFDDVVQVIK